MCESDSCMLLFHYLPIRTIYFVLLAHVRTLSNHGQAEIDIKNEEQKYLHFRFSVLCNTFKFIFLFIFSFICIKKVKLYIVVTVLLQVYMHVVSLVTMVTRG